MNQALVDYYRCPGHLLHFGLKGELSPDAGYFRFGPDVTAYGQVSGGHPAARPDGTLYDAMQDVTTLGSKTNVPFNPTDVINNLRLERYSADRRIDRPQGMVDALARRAYYFARGSMPTVVRTHLQRIWLRNWKELGFPRWPVDCTVENLIERVVMLSLKAQKPATDLPFIWFWPNVAPSCLLMTHDVETAAGIKLCSWLMETNEKFGITASFQFIPEQRYPVPQSLLQDVRKRGFEVAVHDLNHDGTLFSDRDEFLRRANKINHYGRQYGARGYRSGVMYRNQDWYDAFDFQYDMSVPNVAHLDPQRGGCCTVMPYFIGNVLELPVTVAQDYHVFHMLGDYSIELWKRQIELIMVKHGLIHFIVHPDYLNNERAKRTYIHLLEYLSQLRDDHRIWVARPGEVNDWWRQRALMSVTSRDGTWTVSGPGCERASISYASVQNDSLVYRAVSCANVPSAT